MLRNLQNRGIILTIAIFFGAFSIVYTTQVTLAQIDQGAGGSGREATLNGGGTYVVPTYDSPGIGVTNPPGGVDAIGEAAGENTSVQEVPAVTVGYGAGGTIFKFFYDFVIGVFGQLLGLAGALFSYAITNFLLGFGDQYFNKNIGFAVESTWTLVRDLFNLTFIFGLVYIGFKMILDSSDSKARSLLVSLIGAALLVNFSLFITKFIIDIANVAAVVVSKGFTNAGGGYIDISNAFFNLLSLSTILQLDEAQITGLSAGGGFAYIVGLAIFLGTAAFVFAAGGILIIVRFAVLNLYLVFSPVMFIGWVFPSMQKHASKFWDGFLGNAFFAPAYLLLLYLSFQVLNQYAITLKGGAGVDYGALFAGDPSTVGDATAIVPFFVLAMVFLVASLVVAKNMGAVGASTAISIGNKLRGSAQGVMYRNTGGRLSKGALNFMDSTGMSKLPGTRSLRSAVKSGYEYGAGGTSLAKTRSEIKAEKAEITENRSRMFKDAKNKKRDEEIAAGTQKAGKSSPAEIEAMQLAAGGLSAGDLESMTQAQRLAVLPYISSTTAEEFGKSEKVDAGALSEFKKTRSKIIEQSINQGNDVLTSEFSKLSIAQLESVSNEFIMANAEHLTQDQMKAIKGSKKFTEGRVKNIENTRRSRFASGAGFTQTYTHYDSNNVATVKSRARDTKQIAAMPTSALTSTDNSKYMNASVLKELEKNTNLTLADRTHIAENIFGDPTGNQDGRNYLRTSKVINDGNWGQ